MIKIISVLLLPLIFIVSAYGQPVVKTASVNNNELFAGIEIGPKTIRAVALRISSNDEDNNKTTLLFDDTFITKAIYAINGKLTPEYIKETSQTVKILSDQLTKNLQVPPDHLHIIGLSTLSSENPGSLIKEIQEQTGKQLQYLNSDVETQLSIVGLITKLFKQNDSYYDNRSISMLIEIDTNSIRGGYQQLKQTAGGRPDYDFPIFAIPKGISEFSEEAGKFAPESFDNKPFIRMLESNSGPVFKNALLEETTRKPGLLTRKKVYLTGSIVWALSTLLYPGETKGFMSVTMEDINNFHLRAVSDPEALMNPDLSKIKDDKVRDDVRKQREAIKQIFTSRTLIAGAVMLKHIAIDLDFGSRTVLYPRHSGISRILMYIRLQQGALK